MYVTGVNGTLQHLIGVLAGILFGDVQSNQPLSIMDGSVEGDLGCGNRDAETSLLRMHLLLNQNLTRTGDRHVDWTRSRHPCGVLLRHFV